MRGEKKKKKEQEEKESCRMKEGERSHGPICIEADNGSNLEPSISCQLTGTSAIGISVIDISEDDNNKDDK